MYFQSGNQSVKPYALSDGANIATDASQSNAFSVTLGGNRTLDNPTNLVHGMFLTWLVNNGTAPYTLAYGSKFKWGKGGTGSAPVLSTTASKIHVIAGTYDSASDTILAGMLDTASAGAALTNFTEAVGTASPNATIPVVSLTATNAATNVDAAIVPKGTGAFLAQVPDGTTAAGNKRGTNAVDLQFGAAGKIAATNVASGNYSVLIGGQHNTNSGQCGAIFAGTSNTVSTQESVVLGGQANNSGGSYRNTILGGYGNYITGGSEGVAGGSGNTISAGSDSNIALGKSNVISDTAQAGVALGYGNTVGGSAAAAAAIGRSNNVTGNYSVAIGYGHTIDAANTVCLGGQTWARGRDSFLIHCGSAGSAGWYDCHGAMAVLVVDTTDAATTKTLTTDGGAATARNQLSTMSGGVYQAIYFRGLVIGYRTNGTAAVAFSIEALGYGSGSITLVGTPMVIQTFADSALATCTCTVVADTTNHSMAIRVTGVAATTIRWSATVHANFNRAA